MATRLLLLLLFFTGHVFAKEPPDVDCLVVHLKYVQCSWNESGTPEVNYTFYGWFHDRTAKECTSYMSENGINTGCNQHYDSTDRFKTFHIKLVHGNNSFNMKHDLKNKVKFNPPANLTVQNDSNSNLWFYWNQTLKNCVDSEVRYRTNNKKWDTSRVSTGKQDFCINLISSNSRYELQVRSKMGNLCGESIFWSDWSEPVVWGSNNGTESSQINNSISALTLILWVGP
uniref:Fibronectin type-III domain-containing protein n=1 Tax=Dicentrarchus labrax TaxID=13489 RepID=A0A8C4DRI1_DICLA